MAASGAPMTNGDLLAVRELLEEQIQTLRAEMLGHWALDVERSRRTDTALDKSADDITRRFESVNEFRAQLADQARSFLPRVEYGAQHQSLIDRIDGLERRLVETNSRLDLTTGRSTGLTVGWGYLVSGAAFASTVILLIMRITGKG